MCVVFQFLHQLFEGLKNNSGTTSPPMVAVDVRRVVEIVLLWMANRPIRYEHGGAATLDKFNDCRRWTIALVAMSQTHRQHAWTMRLVDKYTISYLAAKTTYSWCDRKRISMWRDMFAFLKRHGLLLVLEVNSRDSILQLYDQIVEKYGARRGGG